MRLPLIRRSAPLALALVVAVGLISSGSPRAAAEPPADPVAWLFDPAAVVEIDLGLPQESIEVLEVEPEEEYQPATFTLKAGTQTWGPFEVGARLKGGIGSFRPLAGKAAFKLKFDELVDGQTFFGLEKLTLNNMVQDPTMVREALAYEAFRAVGVPASRTGYAFVRVNGEAYGLYLNIEVLDSVSLPRWFSSTRHLYEGAYGTDVAPGAAAAFEVDEGKKSNREDLEALIAAAGDEAGDWSDGMAAVADLEQMTRMWAVERYIGHDDGYAGREDALKPNNYYLHSGDLGADAGVFQMLPWGTDQTWGHRLEFDQPAGLLFDRCLADASCAATYREALEQTGSALGALDLDARALELAATVAPWQALESAPRREHSPAAVAAALTAMRSFIADRPRELAEWLQPAPVGSLEEGAGASAPPPSPGPPRRLGKLRVGATKLVAGEVVTPVELPTPGAVVKRVSVRSSGRSVRACSVRVRRARPGPATLRCALPTAIRRRAGHGALALMVRIGFTSAAAAPQSTLRRLVVPGR